MSTGSIVLARVENGWRANKSRWVIAVWAGFGGGVFRREGWCLLEGRRVLCSEVGVNPAISTGARLPGPKTTYPSTSTVYHTGNIAKGLRLHRVRTLPVAIVCHFGMLNWNLV